MKGLFLTLFAFFFCISLFAFIYGHDFKSIGEFFVYLTDRLPLDSAKKLFEYLFGDLFSYSSPGTVIDPNGPWYENFWDKIVSWFSSDAHIGGPSFGGR